MNIVTSLVAGVLMGWVASILMGTDGREGFFRNIAVGVGGALVSSWLLRQLVESANPGGFSFGVMVASLFGAAALLFAVARLTRA